MSSPAYPDLGNLRLARPADIPRIGIVEAAAFRHSSLLQWHRPYYSDYPQDLYLNEKVHIKAAMQDDRAIVLVAEDSYKINENELAEAFIPSDNGWKAPVEGAKVIVGVLWIELAQDTRRNGQFSTSESGQNYNWPTTRTILINRVLADYPILSENLRRDMDFEGTKPWFVQVNDLMNS